MNSFTFSLLVSPTSVHQTLDVVYTHPLSSKLKLRDVDIVDFETNQLTILELQASSVYQKY